MRQLATLWYDEDSGDLVLARLTKEFVSRQQALRVLTLEQAVKVLEIAAVHARIHPDNSL